MMPVTTGDSSPAVAATIASSRLRRPGAICPAASSARPFRLRAKAIRSTSAKRSPIERGARGALDRPGGLPRAQVPLAGRQQQVALLDAVLAWLSTRRWARLSQPLARAASPRASSRNPSQNAARAAASSSPACRRAW